MSALAGANNTPEPGPQRKRGSMNGNVLMHSAHITTHEELLAATSLVSAPPIRNGARSVPLGKTQGCNTLHRVLVAVAHLLSSLGSAGKGVWLPRLAATDSGIAELLR